MSIKMFVSIVHDGVSDDIACSVAQKMFTNVGLPELEVSTTLCEEHVCGDSSSSCICNNLTSRVSS